MSDKPDDTNRHDERDEESGQFAASVPAPRSRGSAAAVTEWYGCEILRYLRMASREKASTRLRLLSNSLDTWRKLYKLAGDTEEISRLREELDELRTLIQSERGIRAVR